MFTWRGGSWGGAGAGGGGWGFGSGLGSYGARYFGSGYNYGGGYGLGAPGVGFGGAGTDCGTACCAGTTTCMGCGPVAGAACAESMGCGGGINSGVGGGDGCGTGCAGGACGGTGGGTILSYVGPGGDYVQETTYRYVGMGAGEFGVVRIPGRGPNCCLVMIIPLGLMLLALPFLLWSMMPVTDTTSTTTTTTTPLVLIPATTPPPDARPARPSTTKKKNIITTSKKAPDTTPPPPPTTPPPPPPPPPTTPPPPPTTTKKEINCAEGKPIDWQVEKKVFCCLHEGKGCPTTPEVPSTEPVTAPLSTSAVITTKMSTTTPCPIDCNAGYNDLDPLQWVRGWSGQKKLYCCKTANKGCPSELPPPSGAPPSGKPAEPDTSIYDCDAGYHHCMHCLVESWSPQKIDYCCKNFHKGCKGEEPE